MDWTESMIARLAQLWTEGLSHTAIGSKMGISKNAVAGKAQRLNLPDRESPFPSQPTGRAAKPKHQPARVPTPGLGVPQGGQVLQGDTLTALGVVPATALAATPLPAAIAVPSLAMPPPVPPKTDAARLRTTFRAGPAGNCQWPLTNGKPWAFCCAATAAGRSYCDEHAKLAFVKFRAFVAIDPASLRAKAAEMVVPGAKTEPLSKILAEVNRRRSSRGQSEFFLPGMSEPTAVAAANATL